MGETARPAAARVLTMQWRSSESQNVGPARCSVNPGPPSDMNPQPQMTNCCSQRPSQSSREDSAGTGIGGLQHCSGIVDGV